MSPGEAFVTGIKMEKRLTFFSGADQGIKMYSERLKSTNQRTFSDN